MGLFPHVYTLFSGHVPALVKCRVTFKAERSYAEVMGLEPTTLSVTQLIGMGGADSAIVYTAVLAKALTHGLKKLLIAVQELPLWSFFSVPCQGQRESVWVSVFFHHSIDVHLQSSGCDSKALRSKGSIAIGTQGFKYRSFAGRQIELLHFSL